MIIPRWQKVKKDTTKRFWKRWDKFVAIIALINFSWIIFDISYLPLRSFWVNKTLFFTAAIEETSFSWLPNPTDEYDKLKGIKSNFSDKNLKKNIEKS